MPCHIAAISTLAPADSYSQASTIDPQASPIRNPGSPMGPRFLWLCSRKNGRHQPTQHSCHQVTYSRPAVGHGVMANAASSGPSSAGICVTGEPNRTMRPVKTKGSQ